ncbi:hypothetical protein LIER_04873 [Lithospermum erythrorhizon]|uniref:Uncharacterized protein n=1 Tax=Lithospermum erythrorhizon TaxID=34254 RepID=A0AAV3P2G2_LITER
MRGLSSWPKDQPIPHAQSEEVDHLSRLATTYYDELPRGVHVEIRESSTYEKAISLPVLEEPDDWRTPIAGYLVIGQLPESSVEARKVKNHNFRFYMYKEELYKKSWDSPLLSCVSQDDIRKILIEVHQGWCESHIGGRSLAVKITRMGRRIRPTTYELERLNGDVIPRTWHSSNLTKYNV